MSQSSFAGITIPYLEETSAKAGLAHAIATVIERTNVTQSAAAGLIGVSQPELSDLLRGNSQAFSIDRLVAFLLRLDCDVEITVRQQRGRLRHGKLGLLTAA